MNSGCDNHPFNRAVDVCAACYLSICEQCIVQLKGRKHPVCHSCALIMSGVNRRTKDQPRGDKSSVKERRRHFHDLAAEGTPAPFTYFDEKAPTTEVDEGDSGRRSWLRRVLSVADSHTGNKTEPEPAAATTRATDLLDNIRSGDEPEEAVVAPIRSESIIPSWQTTFNSMSNDSMSNDSMSNDSMSEDGATGGSDADPVRERLRQLMETPDQLNSR